MAYRWNQNRRFLIDECLSPDLTGIARTLGHDAGHVAHFGRAGMKDWYLLPFILEQDLILVTNNARDFKRLYAKVDLHPGLVVILPVVKQPRQQELFAMALEYIDQHGDVTNTLIEVDKDGGVTAVPWSALD